MNTLNGVSEFRRVAASLVFAAIAVMTGCGSLPPADCQLRAGAARAEGSNWFSGDAVAGAATWVGDAAKCPNFKAFTRTANGSVVCAGSDTWCEKALTNTPVNITPEQLREILNTPDDGS